MFVYFAFILYFCTIKVMYTQDNQKTIICLRIYQKDWNALLKY